MKFKYNIKHLFGGISLALLSAGVLASCTDELKFGDGVVELGNRVEGVLSVPVSVPVPDKMTRGTDFSANASVKVDSYWVAAYDTYTGELLGYKLDTAPRKDDGSRNTIKNNSGVYTVSDIEIYYYQKHPEAYVVSVVNLNDVKAKKAGSGNELYDLSYLLENARTWEDFCAIAVDTESAAAANPDESDGVGKMPLMMGYYTTGTPNIHPTVNPQDNNAVNLSSAKATFSEGGNGKVNLTDGSVKLMRLLSEVTVHVGGPEMNMELMKKLMELYPDMMNSSGPSPIPSRPPLVTPPMEDEDAQLPPFPSYSQNYWDAMDVKVSNIRYKVCNNPKSVFLAEHATDTKAATRSGSDFLKFTANSADHDGDNGYSDSGDWISVNGNTFTYQYYENKHWGDFSWLDKYVQEIIDNEGPVYYPPGYPEMTDEEMFEMTRLELVTMYPYFFREKKHSMDSGAFKSLTPSANNTQNNNAPYFIIKADVVIESPYAEFEPGMPNFSGTVEYVVHEGFNSAASGEGVYNEVTKLMKNAPTSDDVYKGKMTWEEYYAKMAEFNRKMMNLYSQMGSDYQRTRNTQYEYFISILGLDQLWVNVNNHSWGDYVADELNQDGVSGEMKLLVPMELDGRGSIYEESYGDKVYADYDLPKEMLKVFIENKGNLQWRYVSNTPSGQQNYGKWDTAEDWAHGVAPMTSPIQASVPNNIKDQIRFLLVDYDGPEVRKYPNADSEGSIYGTILKEWNFEEFMNNPGDIDPSVLDDESVYLGIYVSRLDTDVPFAQIDQVYRDFYIKMPVGVGEDGRSKYNYYFSVKQKPSDVRVDLTDEQHYYDYYPDLEYYCNVHHAHEVNPYNYSYYDMFTGTSGLVTYICWYANSFTSLGIRPESWEIEFPGQEVIKVDANDPRYNSGDGFMHYPYSIPNIISEEPLTMKMKPVNFVNISDGQPAAYKASLPYVYEYTLYVNPIPKWNFNLWQLNYYSEPAASFRYYDGTSYGYATMESFGMTLNPEMQPHFYPQDSNEEKNKIQGYIQTNGKGDMGKRSFTVNIDRPGTFKVEASWTGSNPPSDDRYIMLYNSKLNRVVDEKLVTNKSNEYGVKYELRATDMTAGDPVKMGIFGSASLRIYSIEFIPD